MNAAPSVLIVDRSADNREVLRTVLEQRGLRIYEAPEPEQGLALARTHQPDVIVFDAECDASEDGQPTLRLDAEAAEQHSRLVILGRFRGPERSAGKHSPSTSHVAKPYHFAPLVHTIQQLAAKAA
jgi:CheY-like chemotaxis protein